MRSFATGVLCALLLAGAAYFGLRAGTVTMVEKSSDHSTKLEGVLTSGSPVGIAGAAAAEKPGG